MLSGLCTVKKTHGLPVATVSGPCFLRLESDLIRTGYGPDTDQIRTGGLFDQVAAVGEGGQYDG